MVMSREFDKVGHTIIVAHSFGVCGSHVVNAVLVRVLTAGLPGGKGMLYRVRDD